MKTRIIFFKNTTPKCQELFLSEKLYNEWTSRPSLIGNANGFLIGGQIILTSNNGGGPFDSGGNMPPRGDGGGPLRGCNSGPLRDQNPKSYVTGPVGPWIWPT
jgi:hypothetical protein